MQNRTPHAPNGGAPIPAFDAVPRKYRQDGWTSERQRAFIDALAELGSVRAAAKRINMSSEGAYYLRRQPGADTFRAAWDAALDHGVQRLADIAIDRAIDGVPVPVFWRGEQVGEKRWFNDRLLMFILKHHQPQRYNPLMLKPGSRQIETLKDEWQQERRAEDRMSYDRSADDVRRRIDRLRGHLLRDLAADPRTRAAWDLIVGPTDWDAVTGWDGETQTQFVDDNMTGNSTIVALAQRWGPEGEAASDCLLGAVPGCIPAETDEEIAEESG